MRTRLVSLTAASVVLLGQVVPGVARPMPAKTTLPPVHHQVTRASTVPHLQGARYSPVYTWLGVSGRNFWSGALAGSHRVAVPTSPKSNLTVVRRFKSDSIANLSNEIKTISTEINTQSSQAGAVGSNNATGTNTGELTAELKADEKVLNHTEEEDGEIDVNSEIVTNTTVMNKITTMDFAALPPEVNSGRMYSGPGSGAMLSAASAWDGLAADLQSSASSYSNVISQLSGGAWQGTGSATTASAAAPYAGWLSASAGQAESTANQAHQSASAFESALTATVHPTTTVLPAGSDEVSAAIAAQFGSHGQEYQNMSQQAAAFHDQFVQALGNAGPTYATTETGSPKVMLAAPPNAGVDAGALPAAINSVPSQRSASEAASGEPANTSSPAPKLSRLTHAQLEQIGTSAGTHSLTTAEAGNLVDSHSDTGISSAHDVSSPQGHDAEPPDLLTLTEAQIDSVLPSLTTQMVQSLTAEQLHHLHAAAVERLNLPKQALFSAAAFDTSELNALASRGIAFGHNSSAATLDLKNGFVFFMPSSDISVRTHQAVVSIPKGAAVWIMENGADVAILDFHDSRLSGPVKAVTHDKTIVLSPGMEVLFSANATAGIESLNPGGFIGYRNVRLVDGASGGKVFVCDFSIPDGMLHIQFLHNMLMSKDPKQQKLAHNILKDAAILADLTGFDYNTATPQK